MCLQNSEGASTGSGGSDGPCIIQGRKVLLGVSEVALLSYEVLVLNVLLVSCVEFVVGILFYLFYFITCLRSAERNRAAPLGSKNSLTFK